MRPAPGNIPNVMPSYEEVCRNIVYLMDMPRTRLGDYAISDLVQQFSDGSPKWLTGSTVWLPAVFGQVEKDTDLDIVFQTEAGMTKFVDYTLAELNAKHIGYFKGTNGNNGLRIYHPDGMHVIDTWHLEEDESIQEMLMTFPYHYQRCAYFMTWGGSSPSYLTRIVKERVRIREARAGGGYGR